jgi:hypothetical protein
MVDAGEIACEPIGQARLAAILAWRRALAPKFGPRSTYLHARAERRVSFWRVRAVAWQNPEALSVADGGFCETARRLIVG